MVFQQWKQQFTSWFCFGDSRYLEALENLEKKSEAPPLAAYNSNERDMSQPLFAVLTSYLRGRCVISTDKPQDSGEESKTQAVGKNQKTTSRWGRI